MGQRERGTNVKLPGPHARLLRGLRSPPQFSTPPARAAQEGGNGACSRSLMPCLCCSILLGLCPCSRVGPTPGRQSSTNCPSEGPSHGVQPLRNRLLQPGDRVPQGLTSPASKRLRRRLLSTLPQLLPGPGSCTHSPRGHSLLWSPLLWRGVLHGLQVEIRKQWIDSRNVTESCHTPTQLPEGGKVPLARGLGQG